MAISLGVYPIFRHTKFIQFIWRPSHVPNCAPAMSLSLAFVPVTGAMCSWSTTHLITLPVGVELDTVRYSGHVWEFAELAVKWSAKQHGSWVVHLSSTPHSHSKCLPFCILASLEVFLSAHWPLLRWQVALKMEPLLALLFMQTWSWNQLQVFRTIWRCIEITSTHASVSHFRHVQTSNMPLHTTSTSLSSPKWVPNNNMFLDNLG